MEKRIGLSDKEVENWKKKLKASGEKKMKTQALNTVGSIDKVLQENAAKSVKLKDKHRILKASGMTNFAQRTKFVNTGIADELYRKLEAKEISLEEFKAGDNGEIKQTPDVKKTLKAKEKHDKEYKPFQKKADADKAPAYARKTDAHIVSKELLAVLKGTQKLLGNGVKVEKGIMTVPGKTKKSGDLVLIGYKRKRKNQNFVVDAVHFYKAVNGKRSRMRNWLYCSVGAEKLKAEIQKLNK